MSGQIMTERFEMRLSPSVLEQVDTWRARQNDLPSRSEAVRRLVEVGLAATGGDNHIKLGDGDKLILIMLCDLFKQLKLKDGEIEPEFLRETILGGHNWGLAWKYSGIFHGQEDAKEAVVSEVLDILEMWSFLEAGYAGLSKKDKARVAAKADPIGKRVVFHGFDGNNESKYLSVAHFLIEQLDRFSEFKGRELNAHMPTIDTYRRMFAVFEPIRGTMTGRDLDASEIIEILKAWPHPSRRKPDATSKRDALQ